VQEKPALGKQSSKTSLKKFLTKDNDESKTMEAENYAQPGQVVTIYKNIERFLY
jgi:hypothetical protein